MARKQRRRKKQTKTEQYNTLRTGLQFFGVDLKELKRATSKAIKAAQKIYKGIRKQLQSEGVTDLPNIKQLAKQVREQEKQQQENPPYTEPEEREPLPYADENEAPQIDFSSAILDDFMETLNEALSDLIRIYGTSPSIMNVVTKEHAEIIQLFNQIRDKIGDDMLASYIENNLDYDKLKDITRMKYGEAIEVMDNITENLRAVLNDVSDYYREENSPFIAPTRIKFVDSIDEIL